MSMNLAIITQKHQEIYDNFVEINQMKTQQILNQLKLSQDLETILMMIVL